MGFEGLHETVIADVLNAIKTGVEKTDNLMQARASSKGIANLTKASSLSKATEGLVLVSPVLCTTSTPAETACMIAKAVETKMISMLQIAFSAYNITNCKDAVSFVKQFHNNIGSGKMSVDTFMDAMDSLPSNESYVMDMVTRANVKKVLQEFSKMEYYFEEDLSEVSLNDFTVVSRNGIVSVLEGKGGKGKGKNNNNSDDDDSNKKKDKFGSSAWKYQKDMEKNEFDMAAKLRDEERQKQRDARQDSDSDRTYNLNKDKFDHQKDVDALDMAKTQFDMIKNQLLPTDVKKANEMVPSMMIINFTVTPDGNSNLSAPIYSQAVIGVKAKLYPVSPDDVINKIMSKHTDRNVFLKLIKVSTREINFVRDFLLAIDDAKLNAVSTSVKGSETNKLFRVLERRALKGKVRKRLDLANPFKAISTLVISREEADYIIKYKNIDISKPPIIRKIMEELNLMMFIIADDSSEYIEMLMDTGDDIYERISYTHLQRESTDGSYKKALNLMTKLTR